MIIFQHFSTAIGVTPTPFRELTDWSIDHLHLTRSRSGNRYVIAAVDRFSKYLVCQPVESLSQQTCASFLRLLFTLFPDAASVYGDNAFDNVVCDKICKENNVQLDYTASNNSRSNNVERQNGTIRPLLDRHLKAENGHPDDWDLYLPRICQAYNQTQQCRATKWNDSAAAWSPSQCRKRPSRWLGFISTTHLPGIQPDSSRHHKNISVPLGSQQNTHTTNRTIQYRIPRYTQSAGTHTSTQLKKQIFCTNFRQNPHLTTWYRNSHPLQCQIYADSCQNSTRLRLHCENTEIWQRSLQRHTRGKTSYFGNYPREQHDFIQIRISCR